MKKLTNDQKMKLAKSVVRKARKEVVRMPITANDRYTFMVHVVCPAIDEIKFSSKKESDAVVEIINDLIEADVLISQLKRK